MVNLLGHDLSKRGELYQNGKNETEMTAMWIHYIGEIMIGVTIALVAAHLGVHAYFKHRKRKRKIQDETP